MRKLIISILLSLSLLFPIFNPVHTPQIQATITAETPRVSWTGDGANTTFTYPFRIFNDTEILVYVEDLIQIRNVYYTVSMNVGGIGGNIIFEAAYIPGDGDRVDIVRNIPLTQTIDLREGDRFPAETFEASLDKQTMILQDINSKVGMLQTESGLTTLDPDIIVGMLTGKDLKLGGPWLDARAFGTIENANTAAILVGRTLLISSNWTLTSNTTLTASILRIPGGSFTKASTYTLTINGKFTNPDNGQCFIGFDAGDVTFGSGSISEVHPEWWGIDGINDEEQFACAIASISNGSVIASQEYIFSTGLVVNKSNIFIDGINWYKSKIYADYLGDVPVIQFKGIAGARVDYNGLRNIYIYSCSEITGTPTGIAVEFDYSVGATLENVFIEHFGKTALNFLSTWETVGNNLRFLYNGKNGSDSTGVINFDTSIAYPSQCTQMNFTNLILGSYGHHLRFNNINGNSSININNLQIETQLPNSIVDDNAIIYINYGVGLKISNAQITLNTKNTSTANGHIIELGSTFSRDISFLNSRFSYQGITNASIDSMVEYNTNGGVIDFVNCVFDDNNNNLVNNKFFNFTTGGAGIARLKNCGFHTNKDSTQLVSSNAYIQGDYFIEQTGVIGYYQFYAFHNFTDGDATPSVKVLGNDKFVANYTDPQTITDFSDKYLGQHFIIIFLSSNITIDFTTSNLKGNAGVDWTPTAYDWMECYTDGNFTWCSVHDTTP